MSAFYRTMALLAFSFVFVTLVQGQSRLPGLKLETQVVQAQENGLTQAESAQVIPIMDAYQNPGERSIHVHVNRLTGGSNVHISLVMPNGRLVRNRSVHICTMCGTFDIDLEDEISQGRHNVIVDVNGYVLTSTIWIE